MKQVLQHLRSGEIELAPKRCPSFGAGRLLVQTTRRLIPAGTKRSLVEFSQADVIGKTRAQPEQVKQVREKIKADDLLPTMDAVCSRPDEPLPLGYGHDRDVIEAEREMSEFSAGDRVASNGSHAEIVSVPKSLATRIRDQVTDNPTSLTVLEAIASKDVDLQPLIRDHVEHGRAGDASPPMIDNAGATGPMLSNPEQAPPVDRTVKTVSPTMQPSLAFSKDGVEISSKGRSLALDNWRRIVPIDRQGAGAMKMRQDKGHTTKVASFLDRVRSGGQPLIPFSEWATTTEASFGIVRSVKEGCVVRLSPEAMA